MSRVESRNVCSAQSGCPTWSVADSPLGPAYKPLWTIKTKLDRIRRAAQSQQHFGWRYLHQGPAYLLDLCLPCYSVHPSHHHVSVDGVRSSIYLHRLLIAEIRLPACCISLFYCHIIAMATMRGTRVPVGSAAWITDERSSARQMTQSEVEEFSFSARNEIEWLNEHMAEIFSENQM